MHNDATFIGLPFHVTQHAFSSLPSKDYWRVREWNTKCNDYYQQNYENDCEKRRKFYQLARFISIIPTFNPHTVFTDYQHELQLHDRIGSNHTIQDVYFMEIQSLI